MHYISTGQGSSVILIHGLFGNSDNLKTLARSLEANHRVIRVDVPNHGLSEHWESMDYPSLAQAVIELMDSLSISKAHLVGHSMGGKIAMAAALNYPERIQSLIAADIAPVSYQSRHDVVFAALDSIELSQVQNRAQALSQLLHAGIDEGTAQFLLKNLSKSDAGFTWKMNLTGLKKCYPHLIGWYNDKVIPLQYTGASLFIRGGESDYVTSEHRQAILTQFPHVQAKTIEGTGHWLHAQKPTVFNRIVGDFIAMNEWN